MKYKVGDIVKIRDDLIVGEKYGGFTFFSGMMELVGRPVTISSIHNGDYRFKEDTGMEIFKWLYGVEMLKEVNED